VLGHVEVKLSSEYLILSCLEAGELGLDPVKEVKSILSLDLVPSIWLFLTLRLET
jgi:hypothetical protein